VIAALHLSRLADELVIWSTAGFSFVRFSDRFSTGSSIMPQKRNPDAAELVRAKTGRILGALTALTVVMKGLPLAYSKDLQEDKQATFDALESLTLCLSAMTGMIADIAFDREAMAAAAGAGFATATDLADWLVREAGVPFREAHKIVGKLVSMAEEKGCALEGLTIEDFKSVDERLDARAFKVLSVAASVASRTSYGGTAPDNVRAQITRWRQQLAGKG
jgi:argininosuccinate lyase